MPPSRRALNALLPASCCHARCGGAGCCRVRSLSADVPWLPARLQAGLLQPTYKASLCQLYVATGALAPDVACCRQYGALAAGAWACLAVSVAGPLCRLLPERMGLLRGARPL